jgi:hypothetical protein
VGERLTSLFGWSFSNSWTTPIIGAAGFVAAVIGVLLGDGSSTDRRHGRLAAGGVLLLLPSLVGSSVSEPIALLVTTVLPAIAAGVFGILGIHVSRTRTAPWNTIGWTLAAASALWFAWTMSWGTLALLPPAAIAAITEVSIPAGTALELLVLISVIVITNRWVGTALLSGLRSLWRSAEVR